jgi:hypothetical protein
MSLWQFQGLLRTHTFISLQEMVRPVPAADCNTKHPWIVLTGDLLLQVCNAVIQAVEIGF